MSASKDKKPVTTSVNPDEVDKAVKEELKAQKQSDTIEVRAADAPASATADAEANVTDLEAELEALRADLAKAHAELARTRAAESGLVEVELESGAPKWVQVVSGMERKAIAGYTVLPGHVLVVKDKDGREGHRFTIPELYRAEAAKG